MTAPIYTLYSGLIYTRFMSIMKEISLSVCVCYCATGCDIRFEFSSAEIVISEKRCRMKKYPA